MRLFVYTFRKMQLISTSSRSSRKRKPSLIPTISLLKFTLVRRNPLPLLLSLHLLDAKIIAVSRLSVIAFDFGSKIGYTRGRPTLSYAIRSNMC